MRRSAGFAPFLFAAGFALAAQEQPAAGASAPAFVYASISEARAVLGARDEYVRATTPLERSAKLRTTEAVDEERFMRHMQDTVLEWTDEQRQKLAPVVHLLARFLDGVKWRMPGSILLIQASAALEDDTPHTRDNAIVMTESFLGRGPGMLTHVLAHETFHVLSRNNTELREKLYAAIGFRRCETVIIPPAIARMRITNPDAVESRHTISVRYQGEPVEALPYVRFSSADIDPRAGFMQQIQVAWLLVDRKGSECRARGGALEDGVAPEQLEGLYERVGRNTQYLFHPEEILADNFSLLFFSTLRGSAQGIRSPEILETMRKILHE